MGNVMYPSTPIIHTSYYPLLHTTSISTKVINGIAQNFYCTRSSTVIMLLLKTSTAQGHQRYCSKLLQHKVINGHQRYSSKLLQHMIIMLLPKTSTAQGHQWSSCYCPKLLLYKVINVIAQNFYCTRSSTLLLKTSTAQCHHIIVQNSYHTRSWLLLPQTASAQGHLCYRPKLLPHKVISVIAANHYCTRSSPLLP